MGTLPAVEPNLMARHAVTPSQSANTPVAARPLSVARAVEVQRSQSQLAPALAPTPVSALAVASPAAGGRAWQTAPPAAMAPLAVLPPHALVPTTVVQRQDAADVPSAADAPVPPTPAAAEPPVTPAVPEAAGTAALGAAGAAGQAQAGAAQAAGEPDELLKKLFDPLLRRLKAELRLDRERRGLLTDRWH